MVDVFEADVYYLKDLSGYTSDLKELEGYLGAQNLYKSAYKAGRFLESQAREEVYMHFNWPFSVNYLKDKGLFPEPNKTAPLPKGRINTTVLGGGYLAVSKAGLMK